jgi:hypothetical protein
VTIFFQPDVNIRASVTASGMDVTNSPVSAFKVYRVPIPSLHRLEPGPGLLQLMPRFAAPVVRAAARRLLLARPSVQDGGLRKVSERLSADG